jgi:hypothetical protein
LILPDTEVRHVRGLADIQETLQCREEVLIQVALVEEVPALLDIAVEVDILLKIEIVLPITT